MIKGARSQVFRRNAWQLGLILFTLLVGPTILALGGCGSRFFSGETVDFNRDVRPILNQNCASCHGGVRQKANVSFLFREEALGKGKSGKATIVPGDPGASELIKRISAGDPEVRMPYHGAPLPAEQINLLRRWIKQGAKWSDYWAFVPPKPQPLPAVKRAEWVRQPMDRFVLARLEKEGLHPSPEAEKAALLRRVSLDLTGLPPTADELAAFLADHSTNSYEKQVDRLLASPAYGERWASMWLDLARYADSYGYESDNLRKGVWAYRDWVIDAFNRNLSYEEFVTKQLAGDLLPNPTFEDKIATSFHRQTPNNQEGGTDDEEFRLVAVMDRVATTWGVLNGLTMNCVQCHSHPYDPIRHSEYYKSLAFFNTSHDTDRDDDFPTLRIPKQKKDYTEAAEIQQESARLVHTVEEADRAVVNATDWKLLPIQSAAADEAPALREELPNYYKYLQKLEKEKVAPKLKEEDIANQLEEIRVAKLRLAQAVNRGKPVITFQLRDGEAYSNPDTPSVSVYQLDGASPLSNLTAIRVEVRPLDEAKAKHTPEDGFIVNRVEAWTVSRSGTKTRLHFRNFLQDSEENLLAAINVVANPKLKPKSPEVGDGFAANPKLFASRWIVGVLEEPLRISADMQIEVRLKQAASIDSKPVQIKRVRVQVSGDNRLAERSRDKDRMEKVGRLKEIEKRFYKMKTVNVPVMSEEEPYERRTTLEFERGNFLNKVGPALEADVPAIFPRLPVNAPRNRLTLAKWFFSPGQPLTARVAVDRYWEQLFGTGIVETLENFGSVGEMPSHPELLDWLALHFQQDLHGDMKALLKELVTSATYRQSAVTTKELSEKDPRNRLLARGPQQRLTAEMVRDQALVASGLLSRKLGGPPVMPPQPPGVWNSVYNRDKWKDAKGPDRYRRAIYTFVKRTSGYPSFLIFDASDRATSLPRRIPTNTPLQALVTLNDPVYDEAAASLAERAIVETRATSTRRGDLPMERLRTEARFVLSRDPSAQEMAVLKNLYQKFAGTTEIKGLKRVSFQTNGPENDGTVRQQKEFEALKATASALINSDAALTR